MKNLLFSVTKDDFEFDTFNGQGKGGQNRNKREMCIRCVHKESGAVGVGQDERSQLHNKKNAFNRCISSKEFKAWMNRKIYEIQKGFTLEEKVNKLMGNEYVKVEVQEDGRWVTLDNGEKIVY